MNSENFCSGVAFVIAVRISHTRVRGQRGYPVSKIAGSPEEKRSTFVMLMAQFAGEQLKKVGGRLV